MNNFNDQVTAAGLQIEIYIDGAYHPNKGTENAYRKRCQNEARDQFLAIASSCDRSLFDEMVGKMMSACFVREDLVFNLKRWCNENGISIFSAPFECDPQLIEGELGLNRNRSSTAQVRAIYTVDSDIFALGSRVVVDNLNFSNLSCNIIKRDEVFQSGKLSNRDGSPYDMSIYAAFVGCDFIPHPFLQSVTYVTDTLMPKWSAANCDSNQESEILAEISKARKWKKGDANTCLDYADKFHTAKNMFRHPPVFKLDHTGGILLCPLHPIVSGRNWHELISFSPYETLQTIYTESHPGELLSPEILKKMYEVDIWSRTGRPLENVKQQICNGIVVPFGSVLDFSIIPVEMQSNDALITWLQFRKLHFKTTISTPAERQALEAVVKRCCILGDNGPPIVTESFAVGNGLYVMWNTLKPSIIGEPVDWITDEDLILNLIRHEIINFDTDQVNYIFGRQRNGVRHRAKKCLFGGCINLKTMKMCMLKRKDNDDDVWLLTIKVTPSMKTKEIYWTTIVLDKETKSFCQSPYSGCDCPAGQMFCSHMLAVILLLGIIQENKEDSFNEIYATLPEPILGMQSLPVKLKFIF